VAPASKPSDGSRTAETDAYLLNAFIRTVSHDMRSPVLALSLSAELLADALSADERSRMAYDGLTEGIAELERLLDAVSGVSRARSRILTGQPVRVGDLLDGHIVHATDERAADARVAVDPRGVVEAITALVRAPAEVWLELEDSSAAVSMMLPDDLAGLTDDPLRALLTSLQEYAGTAVATLAASQVLLERQGGAVLCEAGRATLRLPLAR
jgi:hypothetical protein